MTKSSRHATLFGIFTAAAALGGPGCVIDSHQDSAITLGWQIEDDRGVRGTCTEVGGVTVHMDLLNLDSEDHYAFDFDCKAKAGRTTSLVPGEYRVSVALLNQAGEVLSALDFQRTYFVYRDSITDIGLVVFQAFPPDQYFSLSWSIQKQASGAILSCAQAAAPGVDLITALPGEAPQTYHFNCDDHVGQTTTVAPGNYAVTVNLVDFGNKVLSTASMQSVVVRSGVPTALPPIIFEVL